MKITIDNICNQPTGSFKKYTAAKKVASKLASCLQNQEIKLNIHEIRALSEYSKELKDLMFIASV